MGFRWTGGALLAFGCDLLLIPSHFGQFLLFRKKNLALHNYRIGRRQNLCKMSSTLVWQRDSKERLLGGGVASQILLGEGLSRKMAMETSTRKSPCDF